MRGSNYKYLSSALEELWTQISEITKNYDVTYCDTTAD